MHIKRRVFFGVILSALAALAIAGTVAAEYQFRYGYSNPSFDYGWGIGQLWHSDSFYKFWDSGQGRYTQYWVPQNQSYGQVYVDPSSPVDIVSAYKMLNKTNGQVGYWYYQHVDQGQYYWAYWPVTDQYFALPVGGDYSNMHWAYEFPGYPNPYTYKTVNYIYYYYSESFYGPWVGA